MKRAAILAALAMMLSSATALAAGEPHFDVDARIDPKTKLLKADVTVTLPPDVAGTGTSLVLGKRFTLRSVDLNGAGYYSIEPAERPIKNLQKLNITFVGKSDQPRVLRFVYDGPLNPNDTTNNERVWWKDGLELNCEGGWLPFSPNLSLLFTVNAKIKGIPSDLVVVAPGHVEHKGDVVTMRRDVTDLDLPLVAISGLKKDGSHEFELYARDLNGKLESIFRRHAIPSIRFYTELYGPLPASEDPVRMAVVPRTGAGYERRGFISVSDAKAELAKVPVLPENGPTRHVAHEVAHAWWWRGDPMTEDYWLMESMAEYSALRYVEHALGLDQRNELLDRKRKPAETGGAILGKGRPNRTALYVKGPVLLFDLEAKIGRPAMDKFLRALGRNPPTTTAAYLAILEESAGPAVRQEFEARLRSETM
jgi:hypothetical protein